jgi:hypothetical protein
MRSAAATSRDARLTEPHDDEAVLAGASPASPWMIRRLPTGDGLRGREWGPRAPVAARSVGINEMEVQMSIHLRFVFPEQTAQTI